MKHGDFTNLAGDYSKYRPSYNTSVVRTILGTVGKEPCSIKAADVGAGTGIFTKCLMDAGIQNLVAVEPNTDMRERGIEFLGENVDFVSGSAEKTGLEPGKFDLITMASSFHWPNTQLALKEFDRILSDKGVFCALWNPRLTEKSALESEVQELLTTKFKVGSRVSSGRSGITKELREILINSELFSSVIYVDAVDVVKRTHEEYIGAWCSVNDIQAQLGKEKFGEFISDVDKIIKKREFVEVHYLTRAWIASKR